jgi:hypothetical protein
MSWRKSREDDCMLRMFEMGLVHQPRLFEVRRGRAV